MFSKSAFVLLLGSFVLSSCSEKKEPMSNEISSLKYARGFAVTSHETFTEIEVFQARSSLKYILVPKGNAVPSHLSDVQIIRTPITNLVCTSTSHVAILDHLNEVNKLVGFPSTDLISSASARERIDSGQVTDLGIDKEMNLELLASLQPELVIGYSISGDMLKLDKIQELGIPVVINCEYLEEHPLGRAEWIKFMAPFFQKEALADSIFNFVEKQYLETQKLIPEENKRPTVLSGILYGDTWFLPGGQNYAAQLFRDAGYTYLWDSDPTSGFLQLSFESVFAQAQDADYWIGVGSFNSLGELANAEERYSLFRPFRENRVYTYDARRGSTGGSQYLELGYSRPDIILKDLIKIAHPELLDDHQLFFHQRLQ